MRGRLFLEVDRFVDLGLRADLVVFVAVLVFRVEDLTTPCSRNFFLSCAIVPLPFRELQAPQSN